MVSATLLLLLFTILAQFFRVSYSITHEELERSSLEQTLLTLNNRLSADLAEVSPAGVSLSVAGLDLSLHPVTLSDIGSVVYQNKFLLWHHDPTELLLTRAQSLDHPDYPFDGTAIRFPEDILVNLSATPHFQVSQEYRKIKTFTVRGHSGVDAPFVASPLTVELVGQLDLADARPEITLTRVFHLRNSGS